MSKISEEALGALVAIAASVAVPASPANARDMDVNNACKAVNEAITALKSDEIKKDCKKMSSNSKVSEDFALAFGIDEFEQAFAQGFPTQNEPEIVSAKLTINDGSNGMPIDLLTQTKPNSAAANLLPNHLR